jgi:UDP-3-O-[3-hydroxymyristoyl] glucosamine N-acyltransferase
MVWDCERCHIGTDCIIHPKCSYWADGFGFRPAERGLVKIPQIGNVIIG